MLLSVLDESEEWTFVSMTHRAAFELFRCLSERSLDEGGRGQDVDEREHYRLWRCVYTRSRGSYLLWKVSVD